MTALSSRHRDPAQAQPRSSQPRLSRLSGRDERHVRRGRPPRTTDPVIPALQPDGNLPAGIHTATFAEMRARFGRTRRRRELVGGLHAALTALKNAGCATAYVDGSFVTSKVRPNDFDGCWDATGVDATLLDPVLLTFDNGRAAQKQKYGGEFFPAHLLASPVGPAYLDFFQKDRASGAPKGIIAIDLTKLP